MNRLKLLELFGGIGACSKALERLGINYEIADYVEIDKYAVKSFNAIHGTNFEPQDICNWNKDIEVDLIFHGSPCQDFSLAGKQAGGDEGTGTRSSLMYETLRIVEKLKPKYVIWENVKNVISKKHRHNFDNYLSEMESLGYTNYWQVLNAKDYGIPQNRERVFTISILGNENYEFPNKQNEPNLQEFLEKDIDIKTKPMCEKAFNEEYEQIITSEKDIYQCNVSSGYQDCKVGIKVSPTIRVNNNYTHILQRFEFPPKQELKLKLKDMLEDEVDEKYYLSDSFIKKITINKNTENYIEWERINGGLEHLCRAYKEDKNICTLHTKSNEIKVLEATKQGYKEAYDGDSVNLAYPDSETRRGRVGNQVAQTLQCNDNMGVVEKIGIYNHDGSEKFTKGKRDLGFKENAPALRTQPRYSIYKSNDLRIRKLTPKECFRLMGFDDVDFDKASKVNSNTQLYKQAGNSICVNVLEAILTNLLK